MRSTARAVLVKRMLPKGSAAAVLLLLLAFARLAAASSLNGDDLPPMNPPIVTDDDSSTPITFEWPNEGPWPLSDAAEAEYLEVVEERTSEYDSPSDMPISETEDDLLAEAHRKLAGVDDVLEDINDWFKGVGRNIRRRILQAPTTPAPAPKAPSPTPAPKAPAPAPTPAPKAPAPAPTSTPAPTTTTPTQPTTPTTPTPTPTTPAPGTSTPPTTTTGATTPTTGSVAADAATSTGDVNTNPAANPDEAVTPSAIKPGEKVPEAVQQQQDAALKAQQEAAAQAAAGQVVQAFVPADIVSVAFRVADMTPDMFNSFHMANTLETLARVTGTPADQWKATLAAKTSTRVLLQATATPATSGSSSYLAVSLSILTRNPQLVVYRLAQAPLGGAAGSGCSTELCTRLIAAGVPIVPDTVVVAPVYSSVYQFGTPAVSQADEKLANAQRTGAIVGACVGGGVVLILLLFTYKKIINCFQGQINSIRAKKRAKAAAGAPKPQEPELPKTLDVSAPKAEPPVKFLSLSGSVSGTQEALPHHTSMYKQGSGSSSGIPVGPATGPAHSVTPWAEGDESAHHDQDGKYLPVPPTAASLAGLAHQQKQQQQQQGTLYRDSNSFRQWAASAVAPGPNTPSNTPSNSVADIPTSKSSEHVPRPVSPATAANLAAEMPGSPISSPMYATPAVGSPMKTSATVDVMRLQQMLDAYHLEHDQELPPAAYPAARARAHTVTGASVGSGAGVAVPAGLKSMVSTATPASPLAAAGWSGSGAAGAGPVRSAVYPKRTSTPGSPHAGMSYSTLRAASSPGHNIPGEAAAAEPADRQFFFPWSTGR